MSICVSYSKTLKFSHLLFKILSWFISFNLFSFNFLKYLSIDLIECSLLIGKILITFGREKRENIKAKTILLKIVFWHVILIKKNSFSIIIIKSSLVRIRYHIIGLLNLNKHFFGIIRRILIWMIFQSQFSICLKINR